MNAPIYQQNTDAPWKELEDGKITVLSLKTGDYFDLNSTAAQVWKLFEKNRSLEEVLAILVDHFNTSKDTLSRDLEQAISELVSLELLLPAPSDFENRTDVDETPLPESLQQDYVPMQITKKGNLHIMGQLD